MFTKVKIKDCLDLEIGIKYDDFQDFTFMPLKDFIEEYESQYFNRKVNLEQNVFNFLYLYETDNQDQTLYYAENDRFMRIGDI